MTVRLADLARSWANLSPAPPTSIPTTVSAGIRSTMPTRATDTPVTALIIEAATGMYSASIGKVTSNAHSSAHPKNEPANPKSGRNGAASPDTVRTMFTPSATAANSSAAASADRPLTCTGERRIPRNFAHATHAAVDEIAASHAAVDAMTRSAGA
jgi:hypothetical protein